MLEVVARELEPTRELCEFLYGVRGVVNADRQAQMTVQQEQRPDELEITHSNLH